MWIDIIDEMEAGGELAKAYMEIKSRRGKLSNIMRAHSLRPAAMQAHLNLYISIMFNPSQIRRELKEMIAVVVSGLNKCDYCIHHHATALNNYWKDDLRIRRFVSDYHSMELSDLEKEVLRYAEKLTREPERVQESDIKNLRNIGLSDEDILETNLIVSYFNFVNRIASGLGVTFSEDELTGYRY